MAAPSTSSSIVRFGPFEADLTARELRKQGRKVRLQEQPFRVLALLLQRPGEVVMREDLRQALWPADTFVEFDHGLNTAIKKIRQALNDSADSPRFIETLPRQGYRLLMPVEVPQPLAVNQPHHRLVNWLAVLLGTTAIGAAGAWFLSRSEPEDSIQPIPLTTYVGAETGPSLSPDGTQIAFTWDGETRDNFDIYVKAVGSETPR